MDTCIFWNNTFLASYWYCFVLWVSFNDLSIFLFYVSVSSRNGRFCKHIFSILLLVHQRPSKNTVLVVSLEQKLILEPSLYLNMHLINLAYLWNHYSFKIFLRTFFRAFSSPVCTSFWKKSRRNWSWVWGFVHTGPVPSGFDPIPELGPFLFTQDGRSVYERSVRTGPVCYCPLLYQSEKSSFFINLNMRRMHDGAKEGNI